MGELSLKSALGVLQGLHSYSSMFVFYLLQPGSLGSSMKKRWRKTLPGYSRNQQDKECLSASLPRLKPSSVPLRAEGQGPFWTDLKTPGQLVTGVAFSFTSFAFFPAESQSMCVCIPRNIYYHQ